MNDGSGILAANGSPGRPSDPVAAPDKVDAADRMRPDGFHHERQVPSTDSAWPRPLNLREGHSYGKERSPVRESYLVPSEMNAQHDQKLPRMETQEQHPYPIERRLAELDAFFGADETWAIHHTDPPLEVSTRIAATFKSPFPEAPATRANHHVRSMDGGPAEIGDVFMARSLPATNDANYSISNDPHSYASAYLELVDKLNELPASPSSSIYQDSENENADSSEKGGSKRGAVTSQASVPRGTATTSCHLQLPTMPIPSTKQYPLMREHLWKCSK